MPHIVYDFQICYYWTAGAYYTEAKKGAYVKIYSASITFRRGYIFIRISCEYIWS